MTFDELLTAAREDLRDTVGSQDSDFALTSSMALRYLREAESEACRRSRLLIDSDTAEICTIPVVAGQAVYVLDDRVIKILSAELAGRSTPLFKKFRSKMPAGWKDHTGTVQAFVNDYATGKLRLYRIPDEAGTITLTVQRTPLADLTDSTSPEIPARYHYALVSYVVSRLRSIEDTEMYDPRKAALAMAEFDKEFGTKRSANSEAYEASQHYSEDE